MKKEILIKAKENTIRAEIIPSREELLQSIRPDMRLCKAFFLRIYGYEITSPGFAKIALGKLEAAGCSKAGEYYLRFTAEYEAKRESDMKEAAEWYVGELNKKWNRKEGEEKRKQGIVQGLRQKSDRELLSLLQSMN